MDDGSRDRPARVAEPTRREDGPDQPTASDSVPVPSPMSRVLTVADLPALMRVLGDAAHCTYTLGIQLGLDPHLVRTLKQQAPDDLAKFLSLVLERRIKHVTPPPTLQVICDALSEPPIKDEDLAWRLEQYFLKNKCRSQPLKLGGNAHMSPEMAMFSEFLDAVYENAPIPFDPKGGPTSNSYIKLAVVRKERVSPEEADEFTKATLRGGINQIMNKKEAIELKDIFVPNKGQEKMRFVLVEGAPGIGKSTFAWEICRRRHEIEVMREFPAVVLLPLREKEVQEAECLSDLIYHDNHRIQQAVVDEITFSGGENILLVLDGFDEVPTGLRSNSFLAKLIQGKKLPNATILMTSRPSARADLLSLRQPHQHLEVLGFTHELIEQYASTVFASDPPLVRDFIKYVSTSHCIKSMMYVPLNCAIVAKIYEVNRKAGRLFPQTMTQLYSELTLVLLSRHFMGKGDQLVESLPEKLDDLRQMHPEVYTQLCTVAELAFDGTLNQVMTFEKLPASSSTLDLLTTSQQIYRAGTQHSTYHFFHLTMQEFLSAFYLSQLPGKVQKRAFERYSDEHRFAYMDVVWKFLAGLTGFRGFGWQLVQSRRGRLIENPFNVFEIGERVVSPFLAQCLYEAQEKVDYDSFLGRSEVKYFSGASRSTSAFDSFAVGYCISVSSCTWEVSFDTKLSIPVGPEMVEMLVCGLRSQEKVCGTIRDLNLCSRAIGREGMAHIRKMPSKILMQLVQLDMRGCRLDATAIDHLSDIIPTMTSLRHLNISGNPAAGDGGTVKLLQTLAATSRLHTLSIVGLSLGSGDIAALANLIKPSGNLKKLTVGDPRMSLDCKKLLLKTVFSPSCLEHLAPFCMKLTSCSLAPLKANRNITTLELSDIGSSELFYIAEVLYCNTTLKTLVVKSVYDSKGIQIDYAVRNISHAIRENRTLKVLTLDAKPSSPLRKRHLETLLGALKHNQTLKRLNLHFNNEDFTLWERATMEYRARPNELKFFNILFLLFYALCFLLYYFLIYDCLLRKFRRNNFPAGRTHHHRLVL